MDHSYHNFSFLNISKHDYAFTVRLQCETKKGQYFGSQPLVNIDIREQQTSILKQKMNPCDIAPLCMMCSFGLEGRFTCTSQRLVPY